MDNPIFKIINNMNNINQDSNNNTNTNSNSNTNYVLNRECQYIDHNKHDKKNSRPACSYMYKGSCPYDSMGTRRV